MTAKAAMLALVTDAFGGRGGIAQYNRDFVGALVDSGAVAAVQVLPRHAPDHCLPPARIEQLSPMPGRIAYTMAALRAAVSRSIGIVFCGHLYMAPLAALVARLRGARLIVQIHGIEAWPRPTRLRRAAVEAADLVLCVSRHTRARVLSWAAIEPERVVVLPNTVGEAFTPGNGSALRAQWGLEGKRVLLTVGRMDARERYKGHDLVIQVLPRLIAAGHDVMYIVLGDGNDVGRLESMAVGLGVADRVRFVGVAGPETLVDAYRMADLFVMPSTGEGFGIAFLEAMACGTPALGLPVAGAKDALADGELGIAVAEADLAAAMSRLLAEPKPPADDLAAAAQARFGRAGFVRNVRDALQRLAAVPACDVA
jgi:phosphatidylinositol alpha-1,6-mannosyltransferase